MRAAGKLNKVVDIYRPSVVKSDYGSSDVTWAKVFTTRGALKQINNDRDVVVDEVYYSVTRELILRYYVVVNDFDQVEIDGIRYRIISIDKRFDDQEQVLSIEKVNE